MAATQQKIEETFNSMKQRLSKVAMDAELWLKAELVVEIEELKQQRNAVILGHNYMEPALFHTVPDFRGDSLELSRKAAETDADVIVFCGVEFMAETAKVLNPDKTVLVPSNKAGCSLAESITADDVLRLKEFYPGLPVVTYVNCSAAVKAVSDICCTSSNAVRIVNSLDSKGVIFLPDEYLARNVAQETGKKVYLPQKTSMADLPPNSVIAWGGRCEVHEKFTVEDIENVRKQFPNVHVLAHPECSPEVVNASNFSGSTSAMIHHVAATKAESFLILTECAMADNIIAENPDKEVLRLCSIRCPHMAQITLEMTRDALKFNRYQIEVPEMIRSKAKLALDRMLAIH
jgi:quinolinate synthase